MKEKKFSHLGLEERQIIHVMIASGEKVPVISKQLNRDSSSIYRDLERNRWNNPLWLKLSPLEKALKGNELAQRRQKETKRGRKSILEQAEIRELVISLLKDTHASPETIAQIVCRHELGGPISGKTIRRFIARHYPALLKECPHRGKRPRKSVTRKKKAKTSPDRLSIHERPEDTNARLHIGDFETDTIVCSQTNVAILTVRDRKTRRLWMRRVKDLKADTLRAALFELLQDMRFAFIRSLTIDGGTEFSDLTALAKHFGIKVYVCDPYCSWQKGAVENINKRVRRFIPKGTDLSTISVERLKRIEDILNSLPMTCLEQRSPIDAWYQELTLVRYMLH